MCKFHRILKIILRVKKVLLPPFYILLSVKLFLSEKSKSNEKITLVEDNLLKSEDNDNQKVLNFFFKAAKNLKLPVFHGTHPENADFSAGYICNFF